MSLAVVRAVVESLAWLQFFLEEAADDEVDPDAAVRWLESAARPLWRLSTRERQELGAFCRTFANEAGDRSLHEALMLLIQGADLDHDYGT